MSEREKQIKDILDTLKEMLDELNSNELNELEDSLVNFYGVDQADEDGNIPNFFRDTNTHFLNHLNGIED